MLIPNMMRTVIKLYKYLILLFFLLCCFLHTHAYDFKVDGIYYNILNESEVAVTYGAMDAPPGRYAYSGDVVVPSTVTYSGVSYSVVAIGHSAFINDYNLNSITLPNSIKTIDESAFLKLPITTLDIPSSVDTIGDYAFYGCTNLETIKLANTSIKRIGKGTFLECWALSSLSFPESLEEIDESAFAGCKSIQTIELPNNLKSIGFGAFGSCENLTSIKVPISVLSIGGCAFQSCSKLEFAVLPNSLDSIGSYVFDECPNLVNIKLPTSLKEIPKGLFKGCEKLELSELPSTITSIGDEAFSGCKSISSIILLNSISSIGTHAFYDCIGLNTVISEIEEPFAIDKEVFHNTNYPNHALLMVPYGTISKYKQFIGWTWRFNEIKETPLNHLLTINSTGNGSVVYNSTNVRNSSQTFKEEESSSATISFTPDSGYRIKSVKVNSTDVTSSVYNNSYNLQHYWRYVRGSRF